MYSFAGIYIKLGFRFTWFDLPVSEISYLRNLQLDNSCGPLVITVCNTDLSFKLIWLLSEQSQLQMKNRTYSKYKLTITLLSIECMPIDKCSHPIETTHLICRGNELHYFCMMKTLNINPIYNFNSKIVKRNILNIFRREISLG